MASTHAGPEIRLVVKAELVHARDGGEDWTGVRDSKTRRKLQNRLNVRAHRRRRAAETEALAAATETFTRQILETEPQIPCWNETRQTISTVPLHQIPKPKAPLIPYANPNSPPPPTLELIFPLTPDHLITLTQYNVLRASMTNLRLLGALHTVPRECVLALSVVPAPTTIFETSPMPEMEVPPSLIPTRLQRSVEHDKYINVLPCGVFRDNLIRAKGSYDGLLMRRDILGALWEGFPENENERTDLVVWGEPWDVKGWEVSEGFWRKWGWLLKGCTEVLAATNYWRGVRGEESLVVDI
ncbi:hypothetical protein BJ875DRAFT_544695 [Amylocarpus encephaloides]|uniref:BZIP domain-containing protein n=1 Tax=Amylocarpus encephaloides TaxID=45428 RepID=A0A9P7YEL1_9HELO|nr:hypothetical protein BJ875DRAFT_544695 [Amylocarpus encephaloides]